MVRFNDPDEFFETMAAGGNAMRLKDIKGIGPKTANKINNVREIQGTDDIKQMSADELSDKANISRKRASKAIKGLGGNPGVSKRNKSTGTVSAAGIQQAQGDFMVEFTKLDKARARNDAQTRSKQAVRTDDRKRAPVTTDYDKWKNAPSEWDFPGVDTPKEQPDLLPKDVKAGNPNTTDFEARDEREKKREAQSFPRKASTPSGENNVLETGEDRLLAGDIAGQIPEGGVPGLTPMDMEPDEEAPAFDRESKTMGQRPSSALLSEDAFQGLGTEAPESALASQGKEASGKRETATATVSPNTLHGGWQVDADLAGGLGLPSGVRKKIRERVKSNVDVTAEETPGWKTVATVTLSKPESDPQFNTTWQIDSIDYSEGDIY